MHLKIRRRDGVKSLTTLEESEFKVPIDGCINYTRNIKSPFILKNRTVKRKYQNGTLRVLTLKITYNILQYWLNLNFLFRLKTEI